MERPGLKALLADVDVGLVDVIVVYKVDRLTRSLTDFAKIVERRLDVQDGLLVAVLGASDNYWAVGCQSGFCARLQEVDHQPLISKSSRNGGRVNGHLLICTGKRAF